MGLSKDLYITIPRGHYQDLSAGMDVKPKIMAPIEKGSEMGKVVMVQLPGQSFQLIGFVTREQFDDLPFTPTAEDPVAVYMPMSYMIGGYTLFLPRSSLTPLDMPFEQVMRLVLTGAVTKQRENADESSGETDD